AGRLPPVMGPRVGFRWARRSDAARARRSRRLTAPRARASRGRLLRPEQALPGGQAPADCLTPSGRRATLAVEHTFVPAPEPGDPMLTGRQQEIWKFLTDYVDAHGYPPTVREIGEAVGLASPSTVHAHLANLERAGLIKRDPTKPRALELRRDLRPEPAKGAADVHRLPLVGEIAAGGPLLAEQ